MLCEIGACRKTFANCLSSSRKWSPIDGSLPGFNRIVAFLPSRVLPAPVPLGLLHAPLRSPSPCGIKMETGSSNKQSQYVSVTEAGTPVTTAWFLRMIQRTVVAAKLPFPVHPHMLRHSTGYKLANDGQVLDHLLIIWGIAICNQQRDIRRLRLIDLRSSGRTSVCESPWRRVVGLQGPSAAAAVLSPIPAGLLQDRLSDRS